MSKSILIEGLQASGKTCSLRNLDPKKTFFVNCDGKFDPWKDFSKNYNAKNKNYLKTKDFDKILNLLDVISKEQTQIKYVVIDTISAAMVAREMLDTKSNNGFQKWSDIGSFGYGIMEKANELRDDLVIIMVGHTAVNDEGFETLVTNGRKLEKINLTGYASLVLLTRHEDGQYKFILRSENSSARVPMGYFEDKDEIENDITLVLKELGWEY